MLRIACLLAAVITVGPAAVMRWSVSIGSYDSETAVTGLAVDSKGFIYQVGTTTWREFPTTPGPLSGFAGCCGSTNVFVRKLAPDTFEVVYSVLVGGSGREFSGGIAVDAQGSAYVTGYTESPDFPVTPPFATSRAPEFDKGDAFVFKLSPTGTALVFSRLIGGSGLDAARAIALAPDGRIVVVGSTDSSDLPTTSNALQSAWVSRGFAHYCAYVVRLSSEGAIDYATYLGGTGGARATDVAVDQSGDIYVTGFAGAFFPTLATSLFPEAAHGGFVSKIDHASGQLTYSTYLPGVAYTVKYPPYTFLLALLPKLPPYAPLLIRVDDKRHTYVAGPAVTGFPSTTGAFQTEPASVPYDDYPRDAFLVALDETGRNLVFSTLLGGEGDDSPTGLALTGNSVTIAGFSNSYSFPARDHSLSACNLSSLPDDRYAAFIASFDHSGKLVTSSQFGDCGNYRSSILAQGRSTLLMTGTYYFPHRSFLHSIDMDAVAPVQMAVVANAASLQIGPYAPLEIVTIRGSGLGPKQGVAAPATVGLPSILAGTQVFFNDTAAPLLYVRDDQINAVVPARATQDASIHIRTPAGSSKSLHTRIVGASPGLFTRDGSGVGQGAILNQDGSPNSAANPAARGSVVSLYGTGGGLTDPLFADGQLAAGPAALVLYPFPWVTFGGRVGTVSYAGAAPQLVNGVMQVNVRIPDDAPTGPSVPLVVSMELRSPSGVTLAIK